MRALAILLVLVVSVLASSARADERLDHRGAVGLSLSAGIEHASVGGLTGDTTGLDANRLLLDLTGTFALGNEPHELVLFGRFLHGPDNGAALGIGYRIYFGPDNFKTFTTVSLKADTSPHLAVGPLGQFGAMYDVNALFGIFAQLGLSAELGHGLRFAGEATAGFQARSYLLQ